MGKMIRKVIFFLNMFLKVLICCGSYKGIAYGVLSWYLEDSPNFVIVRRLLRESERL
jgi:hypothetical protein